MKSEATFWAPKTGVLHSLNKDVAAGAAFAIFRRTFNGMKPGHGPSAWGPTMAHENEHHIGSMDISQHRKTYEGFLIGSKWTFGFIIAIMVLLAIFRT